MLLNTKKHEKTVVAERTKIPYKDHHSRN